MRSEVWTFDGQSVLNAKGENVCTKANGHLIACAPDLLEACKSAARRLQGLANGLIVIQGRSSEMKPLADELRAEAEERIATLNAVITKATNTQ